MAKQSRYNKSENREKQFTDDVTEYIKSLEMTLKDATLFMEENTERTIDMLKTTFYEEYYILNPSQDNYLVARFHKVWSKQHWLTAHLLKER